MPRQCLADVNVFMTGVLAQAEYKQPYGCLYVGSDNTLVLWAANKIYNADVDWCVAEDFTGKQSKTRWVVLRDSPDDDYRFAYRCI